MSTAKAPDGTDIYYEVHGDGPLVVIGDNMFSIPDVLTPLQDDLARDHTVARYHPRGVGRSSRNGPYDLDTDARDLVAVLEALGGGAVVVGPANGSVVGVHGFRLQPDLVTAVVAVTGVPVGGSRLEGSLAGSMQVRQAIGTQLESDYRGIIRSITALGNPQDSDERHRRRVELQVEHCPQEAAVGRWDAWFHADATEDSRALGDRLWVLLYPGMPWWPVELAEPLGRVLPEAHIEVIDDGPVSRPDLTAGIVRGITGAEPL